MTDIMQNWLASSNTSAAKRPSSETEEEVLAKMKTSEAEKDEQQAKNIDVVLGEKCDPSSSSSGRSILGPADLSRSASMDPVQPLMQKYPGHMIGKVERRFNSAWFQQYTFLEYSRVVDGAFCFYCRHFSDSDSTSAFVSSGFRAWNRATGKDPKTNAFIMHRNSDEHVLSVQKYNAYKDMTSKKQTVLDMLDTEHRKQVLENRHYLKTVISVLRLTALQNAAQRGHDERLESLNRGNFLEILELVGKHDEIVSKRLDAGPQNAKYTHSSIQNALIEIMGELISEEITEEVLLAQHFSIICDETKDLSKMSNYL